MIPLLNHVGDPARYDELGCCEDMATELYWGSGRAIWDKMMGTQNLRG
ncbi:MAG: hypothetical protein SCAL_001053 [Candidatus Syntrophoarchaeum caldarius]|uniref:Uncharacterized protein n=1 Tax=Candidatus Syntropharchaeum caldarium TaxID=1838285 RepID=A0A1F2P8U2_9EURY|nr:MAG: hypothetical protein SCAL_001053 [Candidatus Syntrophoarchaeum caldarius]